MFLLLLLLYINHFQVRLNVMVVYRRFILIMNSTPQKMGWLSKTSSSSIFSVKNNFIWIQDNPLFLNDKMSLSYLKCLHQNFKYEIKIQTITYTNLLLIKIKYSNLISPKKPIFHRCEVSISPNPKGPPIPHK